MNLRHRRIIEKFLGAQTKINVHDIAADFSISVRTVKNDIYLLNESITGIAAAQIRIKNGEWVEWTLTEQDRSSLADYIYSQNYYAHKLSSEERVMVILIRILQSDSFVTAQELADYLYVSRNTVISDIKQLEGYCKAKAVGWISKKKKGMRIETTERRRRELLMEAVWKYVSIGEGHNRFGLEAYGRFFSDELLLQVKEIVSDTEAEFRLHLSDISFERLVLHIGFMLKRNGSQNSSLFAPAHPLDTESREFRAADRIAKKLEGLFAFEATAEMTLEIMSHIVRGGIRLRDRAQENHVFTDIVVAKLVVFVSADLGVPFYLDKPLYCALFQHLEPALYRLKESHPLDNPLRDSLIKDYSRLYESIRKHLQELGLYEENSGCEDETVISRCILRPLRKSSKDFGIKGLPC